MSEPSPSPSPEAKQAAGKLWSGFPWPDRANKENAKIIQQAIDTATAKLREELEQTRENLYAGLDRDRDDITTPHLATVAVNALALAREELEQVRGDLCKLLAFANLVEPYVSNDRCHGKSELDHKLYDACFEIRPLIAKWTRSYIEGEQLAHQQPSDAVTVELSKRLYHQQPSAPTADVEPDLDYMANLLWSWHEQGRLNPQDIKTALAQARALDDTRLVTEWHKGFAACLEANEGNKARAHEEARAPLVADEERLDWLMSNEGQGWIYQHLGKGRKLHRLVIDAARLTARADLTGTGKK